MRKLSTTNTPRLNFLIISTENKCRGPMAEYVLDDVLKRAKIRGRVASRGINSIVPSRADMNAIAAIRAEFRLDISEHISRILTSADIESADVIFAFAEGHRKYVELVYSLGNKKIILIDSLAERSKGKISDPSGKDIFAFRECGKLIKYYLQEKYPEVR